MNEVADSRVRDAIRRFWAVAVEVGDGLSGTACPDGADRTRLVPYHQKVLGYTVSHRHHPGLLPRQGGPMAKAVKVSASCLSTSTLCLSQPLPRASCHKPMVNGVITVIG